MNEEYLSTEESMRKLALELAVSLVNQVIFSIEGVVDTADKFYEFLKTSDSEQSPTADNS